MSTHSSITVRTDDGRYVGVYCHSDGYLEGVGKTLFDFYGKQRRVEELVALGAISRLERSIAAPRGHSFETPHDDCTVAYHRDRGDELLVYNAATWEGVRRRVDAQYHYLFDKGHWYVLAPSVGRTRALLEQVL